MPPMEGPSPGWVRDDSLAVVSLLVLASVIRLPHLISPYVINMDAINYIEGAKAVLQGRLQEGFGMSHASIYPILVAILYQVLGDWVTAARLLPVVFGILTVVPFYLLAREILTTKLAWMPVLCYVLSPAIFSSSLDVVRDPLLWFGLALFVWMLLRAAVGGRWWRYPCSGAIAVGCMAVRADSLLLVFAGLVVSVYAGLRSGGLCKALHNSAGILLPLAMIGLTLAMLGPGPWRVAALEFRPYGRQIQTALEGGSAGAKQEVRSTISRIPRERKRVARFFSNAWERRWVLMGWGLMEHWVRTAHPGCFALMVIGMARGGTWRDTRWHVLVFLMALFLCIGYIRISGAFAISKRHLVPPALLGYIFAAKGFEGVVLSCKRRWPRLGYRTTAAALASALALVMLVKDLGPVRAEKLIRRQAGEWIRTQGIPNPTVVTDHRHIGFYAEGKSLSVADFMRDPSVEAHFLAWEPERRSDQPDLLQRLEALGWNATFLREFRDSSGSIVVYSLTKPDIIGP